MNSFVIKFCQPAKWAAHVQANEYVIIYVSVCKDEKSRYFNLVGGQKSVWKEKNDIEA